MTRLTDARRRRVAREQRGLCWYCSLRLHDDQTWEHIVARRHGGSDKASNLSVAHASCNSLMGTCPVGLKYVAHDVGHRYGSDAFFLLAVQLRAMSNAHDDYRDLRRRRPKRPPRAVHAANLATFVARLPTEMVAGAVLALAA